MNSHAAPPRPAPALAARILLGLALLVLLTGQPVPRSALAADHGSDAGPPGPRSALAADHGSDAGPTVTTELSGRRQAAGALQSGGAPTVENPGFECSGGYHDEDGVRGMVPDGWTGKILDASRPFLNSTQMWGRTGSCDPKDLGWEKLEGSDSLIFMADYARPGQDFRSPPFDATIYQPAAVISGTAYSVSGWLTSLCGGSASPNDCPDGYYIAKFVGIDPTGGTDASAATVQWVEDRRPHTTAKWVDIRLAATARSFTMTLFVRVRSPFTWHGNHAFADAIKLVRAPTSRFTDLRADPALPGFHADWTGNLGPDIPTIPGGNYHLLYDVQYRRGPTGAWQSWIAGQPAGSADLKLTACDRGQDFWFRVRARAEQPEGEPGASPNHRFPGIWNETGPVRLGTGLPCMPRSYLPLAR